MKVVGVVSDAELLRYMVVGGRASTRFARSSSSFIRSLDLKRGDQVEGKHVLLSHWWANGFTYIYISIKTGEGRRAVNSYVCGVRIERLRLIVVLHAAAV